MRKNLSFGDVDKASWKKVNIMGNGDNITIRWKTEDAATMDLKTARALKITRMHVLSEVDYPDQRAHILLIQTHRFLYVAKIPDREAFDTVMSHFTKKQVHKLGTLAAKYAGETLSYAKTRKAVFGHYLLIVRGAKTFVLQRSAVRNNRDVRINRNVILSKHPVVKSYLSEKDLTKCVWNFVTFRSVSGSNLDIGKTLNQCRIEDVRHIDLIDSDEF